MEWRRRRRLGKQARERREDEARERAYIVEREEKRIERKRERKIKKLKKKKRNQRLMKYLGLREGGGGRGQGNISYTRNALSNKKKK